MASPLNIKTHQILKTTSARLFLLVSYSYSILFLPIPSYSILFLSIPSYSFLFLFFYQATYFSYQAFLFLLLGFFAPKFFSLFYEFSFSAKFLLKSQRKLIVFFSAAQIHPSSHSANLWPQDSSDFFCKNAAGSPRRSPGRGFNKKLAKTKIYRRVENLGFA